MARVLEQWVGHYQAGTSDKVWAAAYYDDGYYEATWGRRGKDLSRQGHQLGVSAARDLFAKKVREKRAEGYVDARFDDRYFGVASFPARSDSATTAPPTPLANRPSPNAPVAARISPPTSTYPVPVARPTKPPETERSARELGVTLDTNTPNFTRGEREEL
jgi:predicted DNA-binding WGR domain protein